MTPVAYAARNAGRLFRTADETTDTTDTTVVYDNGDVVTADGRTVRRFTPAEMAQVRWHCKNNRKYPCV